MKTKLGSELSSEVQRDALALFVNRHTLTNVPTWTHGTNYPVQFKDDADWLAHTRFAVTGRGKLDKRNHFCESSPTWPNNPELRGSIPSVGKTWCATFSYFEIELPTQAVLDCSAPGNRDKQVKEWAQRIIRPATITDAMIREELAEYGAWEASELASEAINWRRVVWLAACQICEENRAEIFNKLTNKS